MPSDSLSPAKESKSVDTLRDFEVVLTDTKKKAAVQISLDDSDEDGAPEDKLLTAFMSRYEEELNQEIAKISEKYEAQIQAFEKKGINPLTKKLIEKAKTEQNVAIESKRQDMEAVKRRETDKIKAGVVSSPDQWSFEQ